MGFMPLGWREVVMQQNDLVRGKKRQRRRTPKARSGCVTCKIRRVKCDEGRPSCEKCLSTGRKCDGYIEEPPTQPNRYPRSTVRGSTSTFPISATASTKDTLDVQSFDIQLYEPSNVIRYPITLGPLPNCHLAGRAFHYFINRSSADLTGPLYSPLWKEHVLSVCSRSVPVQQATVALSGFHERYTMPKAAADEMQCWRQYYLAVKGINTRLDPAYSDKQFAKYEISIACAIFITIEILLGNTDAAIRHLDGGLALIQDCMSKGGTPNFSYYLDDLSSSHSNVAIPPPLDDISADLVGWYARLDLQILSFLPSRYHSASRLNKRPPYGLMELGQPLPTAPSTSLYRLMKRILYWDRHLAHSFKYSHSIPSEVYASRDGLLSRLQEWYCCFQTIVDPMKTDKMDVETAHLLVAYHLAYLKLTSSLSPLETLFDNAQCRFSFWAILKYCALILLDRNPCGQPLTLPADAKQSQFFFSLETSVVEPLYYVALKYRDSAARRSAILLLKCAGREGVWDGIVMSRVAEHVLALEHGDTLPPLTASPQEKDSWLSRIAIMECPEAMKALREERRGVEWIPEHRRVNSVAVNVNRGKKSVEVECGWLQDKSRSWRHERTVLDW